MFLSLMVKGFIMGIAFIIPGVSGGTLAVYLGIYQKMLYAIGNVFKDFKNSIITLFPIFLGIGLSVVSLAKLFSLFIDWNSFIVLFFFIGLIAGGIKHIYLKADVKKVNFSVCLSFLVAFLFLVAVIIIDKTSAVSGIEYFNLGFTTFLLLVLLGMIASITMIVPGISGSAILLVLGFYTAIVSNVVGNIFDFTSIGYNLGVIIPFGIGALIGIIIFSRIIETLLRKYPKETYFAILGFIVASIIGVFLEIKDHNTAINFSNQVPIFKDFFSFLSNNLLTIIFGGLTLVLGFIVSKYLTKFEGRNR
jgi:putative membrane protein